MEDLFPLEHKQLRKIHELIEKHRMPDGKINEETSFEEFDRIFGKYGGEYWTNAHERTSKKVLIPVAAPGFLEANTADAQIYAPPGKVKEVEEEVKKLVESGETKARRVAVGEGNALQYIPYQRKVIEAFVKAHNDLIESFGDRLLLFALRGGMAARNAATIPVKVREKERSFGGHWDKPKIRTYLGTIPDVDPFVVIKDPKPGEFDKAIKILYRRLWEAGIPSALWDIREDTVVADKDISAFAHSLHSLKPLMIFKGQEFLRKISKNRRFRVLKAEEMMRYWDKIDELDRRWFVKMLRPSLKMIGILALADEEKAKKVLNYIRRFLEDRFRVERSTRTGRKIFHTVQETVKIPIRWRDLDPEKRIELQKRIMHDADLKRINELVKHPKKLYRAILFATANDPEAKEVYHVLKTALTLAKVPPELKKRALAGFAIGAIRGREEVGKYLQEGMGMRDAPEMGFANIPKNIKIIKNRNDRSKGQAPLLGF